MDFCSAAATVRSCLLKQSGNAKRMVRIVRFLTIFDFFHSPFFQLNCYFQGYRAIRVITAHRQIFAPPPPAPAHVYYNRAAIQKRMVRIYCVLMILHFFYSPFFQLNCYFWGYRAIRDIAAHSWIFAPPPPPPAHVYYNRATTQKWWWEYILLWWFYSLFTHLFLNQIAIFVLSRDQSYRSPQLDFCPAAAAVRSRVLQQSGNAKRIVRMHCI